MVGEVLRDMTLMTDRLPFVLNYDTMFTILSKTLFLTCDTTMYVTDLITRAFVCLIIYKNE